MSPISDAFIIRFGKTEIVGPVIACLSLQFIIYHAARFQVWRVLDEDYGSAFRITLAFLFTQAESALLKKSLRIYEQR
jgi:hypothetical protein